MPDLSGMDSTCKLKILLFYFFTCKMIIFSLKPVLFSNSIHCCSNVLKDMQISRDFSSASELMDKHYQWLSVYSDTCFYCWLVNSKCVHLTV